MIGKVEILSVLKKYGYYSVNRAPFLYQEDGKFGIYFVWPHKHYGSLERVLFFETTEELETAVFSYWWFMNNKDKYPIMVEFDNYEEKNPYVTYSYKGIPLTIDAMKSFGTDNPSVKEPKDTIKKRQLLRTATILILVLKEKIKEQNEIYLKLEDLSLVRNELKKEYKNKLSLYKKGVKEETESLELLQDDKDESEKLLLKLHGDLNSLETIEDIRAFIDTLFRYLTNLESSVSTIQNQYLLERYPIEIEDMQKKIKVLEEALNAKRKLFQTKQDVFVMLNEIDASSSLKNMEDIKSYIEKHQNEVKEKYQKRAVLDENILGDSIVSFEKLNVTLPPMIEDKYYEEFNKEDLYQNLKVMFEELSKEEKSACYVASSFLRDCLIILLEMHANRSEPISDVIGKIVLANKIHLFNDAYNALDYYVNAKIRVKYFSILNMKTFELFMSSLVEVIEILKGLKQTLNKSFYAYYIDRDKSIINLYLKNIVHLNKKTSYIARFMPNVPIYYSPVCINRQLDIVNNNEFVERQNDVIFLLKDMVSIKTNDNKTVVVQYEKDKTSREDCFIVHSLKEKNRCVYYEDWMYNKEDGGLYE